MDIRYELPLCPLWTTPYGILSHNEYIEQNQFDLILTFIPPVMNPPLSPPAWYEAQWDLPQEAEYTWLLTDDQGFEEYLLPTDLQHAIAHNANQSFTLTFVG